MSDEETRPGTGDEGGEQEQPQEPSPYLTRSKMLPVERVVYCLFHSAVHEETTDPYDSGQAECEAKEHRPVYYRGRKGDIDETPDEVRHRVIAGNDTLSEEERDLVLWLVGQAGDTAQDVVLSLHQIFGDGRGEVAAVEHRLELLKSVHHKLGGDSGEGQES